MGPTSCARPAAFAALVADEEDEQLDHREHEQADVRDEHGGLGGTLDVVRRHPIQATSKMFYDDGATRPLWDRTRGDLYLV